MIAPGIVERVGVKAFPRAGGERNGPLRVGLALVTVLALGLVLLTAWIAGNRYRHFASQQDEIRRFQERLSHLEERFGHLEERLGILSEIRSHRPGLSPAEATALAHVVQREAWRYGLDWGLLLGIIRVESGFDPRARSLRGAVGLMQVMPGAFAEVAAELGWAGRSPDALEDLRVNVRVGAHYLFMLVRRFGDLEKAVQAYYLGPSRIRDMPAEWGRRGRQYLEAVSSRRDRRAGDLDTWRTGKEPRCLSSCPESTARSTSFQRRSARFRS